MATRWTILEERNFYTHFMDSSEVEIEMDIEGIVSIKYGEADIEDVKFTNIKLCLFPGREYWTEVNVKTFDQLKEYIAEDELSKIMDRAETMLIDYGCELMEFEEHRRTYQDRD